MAIIYFLLSAFEDAVRQNVSCLINDRNTLIKRNTNQNKFSFVIRTLPLFPLFYFVFFIASWFFTATTPISVNFIFALLFISYVTALKILFKCTAGITAKYFLKILKVLWLIQWCFFFHLHTYRTSTFFVSRQPISNLGIFFAFFLLISSSVLKILL